MIESERRNSEDSNRTAMIEVAATESTWIGVEKRSTQTGGLVTATERFRDDVAGDQVKK